MKASANRRRGHRSVVVPRRTVTVGEVPVDPQLAKLIVAARERRRADEARLERSVAEMERLVVEAMRADGRTREVAELCGLSHTAVQKIVQRSERP